MNTQSTTIVNIAQLVETTNFSKLVQMAERPSISQQALVALAMSDSIEVRQAVADHPNVPYMTLVHLAQDTSDDVRFHIAGNHNVPDKILARLVDDGNPFVSWRAQKTIERKRAIESDIVALKEESVQAS